MEARIRLRPTSATSHRQTHLGEDPQRPKPPRNLVQARWAPRTATPQRATAGTPSPTLTKATKPKNRAANHYLHLRRNNTVMLTTLEQGSRRQERRQTRHPPDHVARRRPPHPPLKRRPYRHSCSAPPQSPPWRGGHAPPPPQGRRCGRRPRLDPAQASRHLAKGPAVAILGPRRAPVVFYDDDDVRGEGEGGW
jgi:hypothetical protein